MKSGDKVKLTVEAARMFDDQILKTEFIVKRIEKCSFGMLIHPKGRLFKDGAQAVHESYVELVNVKSGTIDEQTIMFWNLQLQFMEMSFDQVNDIHTTLGLQLKPNRFYFQEDLATELALHLSGIE